MSTSLDAARDHQHLDGPDPAPDPPPATRTRARLTVTSLLLVALAMVQSSGRTTSDTKLDLVVSPWRMLRRSLSMWDDLGAFGQVGNQAYGYLWPMGPFFGIGDLLAVPSWAVQRLWMALVLIVAFQGAARVARALGVRSDVALILTGLAYALSPRMVTTVGPISIEAWPSALAPWVLLALVHGSRQGDARRYAVGAGLAVGMVGGVNAAATFAAIPLGAVWVLTRARGPRRRALLLWWPVATLVACAWWLVPLLLLGRYSPPFLDYIETAAITTYPTTLFDALRGATAWIPYLDPRWQAGNDLITVPALIVNTGVLVALGLLGLARVAPREHRAFLSLGLLAGVLMVTAGHLGPFVGWFAGDVNDVLDGALAPFRNVHKFDPVIRLPLVLGVGYLADASVRAWRTRPGMPGGAWSVPRRGAVVIVALALVGAATPAITGRLAPTESFDEVPPYWREAAAWLGDQDRGERALLLPSSSFGSYLWGDTRDEPLQPLATRPWAVRGALPLAPIANIRALDAVEERVNRGQPSAGLALYLRRMGVTYLVVRNDLQPSGAVTDPALVQQALEQSPGIELAASFGPPVGGDPRIETAEGVLAVKSGWQTRRDAVQIYEVTSGVSEAVAAETVPIVVGAPEDLLTLADRGVLRAQPTQLAYDVPADESTTRPVVLTDGLRLRDTFYGSVDDGSSPTLTEEEAAALGSARRDFVITGERRWMTDAVIEGAASVTATSSLSEPDTAGGARTMNLPYAAVDGDPATTWVSGPTAEPRAALTVTYDAPSYVGTVTVTAPDTRNADAPVRVTTEQGTSEVVTLEPGLPVSVPVPAGDTRWVRVSDASEGGRQLSLAEVDLPGTDITRWLRTPAVPDAWGAPDAISLDARPDPRTGCVDVLAAVRCAPDGNRLGGEESAAMRRIVRLPEGGDYRAHLRAIPRPGDTVTELLQRGRLARVEASTLANTDAAAASALAAVDGDAGTTWISSASDSDPALEVSWLGRRVISGVQVQLDDGAAAAEPLELTVAYPGGRQQLTLDEDGAATMDPVRTDQLSVFVSRSVNTANIEDDQTFTPVGVGISELTLDGMPGLTAPLGLEEEDFGCGSGPVLVDATGTRRQTAVVAAPRDLELGRPVDLRPCGGASVRLEAGENRVQLLANQAFAPASVTLTRQGSGTALPAPVPAPREGDGWSWRVPPDARLLVVRQNQNDGWSAERDGTTVEPVVVDGWQQGYWLDAGDAAPAGQEATVTARYGPDLVYRVGMRAGGVALVLLLVLWLGWRRRDVLPGPPPVGQARWAPSAAAAGWLLGAGLVAGWWGFLVLLVSGAVTWTLRRRHVAGWWWPALAPVAVAIGWYAAQPWGSERGWAGADAVPQLAMIVPLALLGVSTLADAPVLRNRWVGSSTNR